MKNKDNIIESDKEKLEAVMKLLSPRKRKYHKNNVKESSQEVIFMVENNAELRYIISCLLRVSILALESDGVLSPPRLPFCSNELAVVTILELIDNILPDDQLESYDKIEELLLSEKEIDQNKRDNTN
jgi:hypothetical protein